MHLHFLQKEDHREDFLHTLTTKAIGSPNNVNAPLWLTDADNSAFRVVSNWKDAKPLLKKSAVVVKKQPRYKAPSYAAAMKNVAPSSKILEGKGMHNST